MSQALFHADRTADTGLLVTFCRFCLVGTSGVVVNFGLFLLLHDLLGQHHLLASALAIETSILWNFALNNLWTWRHRHDGSLRSASFVSRFAKYHLVAMVSAFGGNWLLLLALVDGLGLNVHVSYLLGILLGVAINFLLNNRWTFAKALARDASP